MAPRRFDLVACARRARSPDAEAEIREFDADGSLDDFVARQDAARKECGQVTFFLAARRD